jgi:hypothetical protein
MGKIDNELINVIKAKAPIIQIISYETLRVHALGFLASKELKRDLYIWNRVDGIKKWEFDSKKWLMKITAL